MDLRDVDLIARVLSADDRHAFGELVRRHQSLVRGFLRRLTGGQHALADDLAQETFIEAHRSLAGYRGGAAFSTWLVGIAYNRFRQNRRGARTTVPWQGEATLAEASGDVATSAPGPADAVELRHDLAAALALLPEQERQAIHLCYDGGLSHEEAAAALGWPLGTLKSHISRGKEKLKNHLRAWAPT